MRIYKNHIRVFGVCILSLLTCALFAEAPAPFDTSPLNVESIDACVIPRDLPLNQATRARIASCLGWQEDVLRPLCRGTYDPVEITPMQHTVIRSDRASLSLTGESQVQGHVELYSGERRVTAQTARIYRDPKTERITRIELQDQVHYTDRSGTMWARKVSFNPDKRSGKIEDALYRFENKQAKATLPAWGLAGLIQRFANQNLLLQQATYSTCPPQSRDWHIEAKEIFLEDNKARGVARDAVLRLRDVPVLYTPYLSFPRSKERQTGFLMPLYGYSNIGGFDFAAPFYWNIAPNYDATITPHAYTLRGMMIGGEGRFLTDQSIGMLQANLLPDDQAFHKLPGQSNNRWSVFLQDDTAFTSQLNMHVNYQQVSDDYYLQDFSSNLAVMTENQLRQEGSLTYTSDHWLLRGMAESYQTLNPLNQAFVNHIYQRLPQIYARGLYDELPLNGQLKILGEYDDFQWPVRDQQLLLPEGSRIHFNPILSIAQRESWGYVLPQVQLVEHDYHIAASSYRYTIPRFSVDAGLFLDRQGEWAGERYTQTIEPRLYYLNVPYQNQSFVPAFDSAYMIFTADQLFRDNRFSGQDRIGDANQLAYALTSRWLTERTGREKASVTVGQLAYFANRRVQLCYQQNGLCEDTPLMLGYLSPNTSTSPLASRASYVLNKAWRAEADWVFDINTLGTNNGDFNFHYQPEVNHIIRLGYSYLVNANLFLGRGSDVGHGALHQGTLGYAWPLSPAWSGLGVLNYNLSEHYDMMTFVGAQYDSCCWAVRFLGGRVFKSISSSSLKPEYNNNFYVQILLKGLGSVGNSDSASTIQSYLPGYINQFQR